ncbi:MAG: hypothetical protein JO339_16445 [Alphaproteobacteria bacterium]|nr:hypothetical protein [Alphaproteobacteria bacterium]
MSLTAHSQFSKCFFCSKDATDRPIGGSVGKGGANHKADVRIVQAFLNSTPPEDGGPAFLLAEDGIIGPKTQAAIDKFQAKVLRHPDGRIDVHGPTIKALTALICDSPSVPPGRLGLDGRPGQAAGSPATPPTPPQTGAQMVAEGKQILKDLERNLMSLRFKLLHQTPTTMAWLNKHFETAKVKVTSNDADALLRIVSAIHFQVSRANAFGAQGIDSIIMFDPKADPGVIAWTVRGGDKLSTNQFQIYVDKGVKIKAPGHTVFLGPIFTNQPAPVEKQWTVIHEMCHFVGARDGTGLEINDNAYAFEGHFLTIGKFFKLHNAESISLMILEFAIGTAAVVGTPRLAKFKAHFDVFPKVVAGQIVTS